LSLNPKVAILSSSWRLLPQIAETEYPSTITLAVSGLVLATAALLATSPIAQTHGEPRQQQLFVALLTGVLGGFYWIGHLPRGDVSTSNTFPSGLILLLPMYSVLQAVPLPLSLVRVLSPTRAALTDAVGQVLAKPSWAPISVTPSETVYSSLWLCACVIVFLVALHLSRQLHERPWLLVLPLVAIASAEALIGMVQALGHSAVMATGTYEIKNHFAGLLEMVLPFSCLYPLNVLSARLSGTRVVGLYLLAAGGLTAAALMVAGIIVSQSRMGLLASVAALLVISLVSSRALISGPNRRILSLGIAASIVLVFSLLLPTTLVSHLGDLVAGDENRSEVWLETLPLVKAYPLFGCGLGGYESAFAPYKHSAPMQNQDYAHNDCLQYLAELGGIGLVIIIAPAVTIVRRLILALSNAGHDTHWLILACCGSILAIALHSLVDFNLYVPANMLVLAWIAGISAYLGEGQERMKENIERLSQVA
jgi:O-antigen ligase